VSQGHGAVTERICEDSAVKCQQTLKTLCHSYSNFQSVGSIVVTTSEDAVNRFTIPDPRLSH
jgi:hypothetical protein